MSKSDMWQPKQPASDVVASLGFLLAMTAPHYHFFPAGSELSLAFSIVEPIGSRSYRRCPIGVW